MLRIAVALLLGLFWACGASAQTNSIGTIAPIHTGCQASGGDIIVGNQTISTIVFPTTLSASNAPIISGYCGGAEFFTNGASDAPTIAAAGSAGFPVGWMTYLCNTAAFNRTITPASGTIGGAPTYLLVAGTPAAPQCIQIVSDGVSNYRILGGLVSSTGTNLTNGTSTIAGGTATRILFDNAGVLGEYTISGTGNVAMSASPTFTGTVTLPNGTATSAGLNSITGIGIGTTAPAAGETNATNSAASSPAVTFTGTVFTGGTGTTTTPHFLIQPSNATVGSAWNTTGTVLGINAHTGTGLLIDAQRDGTSLFTVSVGSGSMTLGGNFTMQGAAAIFAANGTGQISWSGRAILTSPAAATLQLGAAAAAAPVAQVVQGQPSRSGSDTNVGGANVTITSGNGTGTGTPSSLILQSPVVVGSGTGAQTQTTAISMTGGAVSMPNIASSSAAQTGTVCWTTGGGNLTVDTTAACLVSLEETKNISGPISGALEEVMALKPFWYSWKDADHFAVDPHEQAGLGAHQVEGVDSKLAAYSPDGSLRGVRYQQLTAVLVAAMQQQQAKIDALEARLTVLEHPNNDATIMLPPGMTLDLLTRANAVH